MKINFDNMRRRATYDINTLAQTLKEVIELESWESVSDTLKNEIIVAFNNASLSTGMFNILFDDGVDGDFSNLSDLETVKLDLGEENV